MKKSATIPLSAPAPVGGLNAVDSVLAMPDLDALVLENFIALPDRLETRPGCANHVTGFVNPVLRLAVYSSLTGTETLWAATNAGIYPATTAGAVGSVAIALTNGKIITTLFSTGAATYLFAVNGTDTMKQYDGSSWTSVATLGAVSTATYSHVDSYRQRLFFVVENSLQLDYLAPNAISGAPTTYLFSSIFKRGGYIVATNSWTLDGGAGPDDYFVIATSQGELAVFSGNDPASWSLKGVFWIGRPLGAMPLFKYGGDLLFNCEAGLFPMSKAILSASIDRTQSVSGKIRPLFNIAAQDYFANDGWQIIAQPDIPLLIVNVPATPMKFQFCMHAITGAWTIFKGWDSNCYARMGGILYFGSAEDVVAVGGAADFGENITATALGAYSRMSYPKKKHVKLIRPYLTADGAFNYTLGVASDFAVELPPGTQISTGSGGAALWGSGVWGTSLWSGSFSTTNDWRSVPDIYATWKALYLQVVSNTVQTSYLGADLRARPGSDF